MLTARVVSAGKPWVPGGVERRERHDLAPMLRSPGGQRYDFGGSGNLET